MNESLPSKGQAVLVGAGPGDVSLATTAALDWLARADCVIYDRLANPALLDFCRKDAELIFVGKGAWHGRLAHASPGRPAQGEAVRGRDAPATHGQDAHATEMNQSEINALLVAKCRVYRLVVRLKGGDPFIFGRGGEECDALVDAGIEFRVVPGVTAGVAAGAFAGIPLTDRRCGPTLAFVAGHEDPAREQSAIDWAALAKIDTVVFYMGVANLPRIAAKLIAAGRPAGTPTAVIERAATPRQRTIEATLATIADAAARADIRPPAIIIVGQVVAMRERLAWFDRLPLAGKTILVTRHERVAGVVSGAGVPPASHAGILPARGMNAVSGVGVPPASGMGVSPMRPTGVSPVAEDCGSETLPRRMAGTPMPPPMPPPMPRANLASRLSELGAEVIESPTIEINFDVGGPLSLEVRGWPEGPGEGESSRANPPSPYPLPSRERDKPAVDSALRRTAAGEFDWLALTSPNGVEAVFRRLAALGLDARALAKVKIAAVGPGTAAALAARSITPDFVPSQFTTQALGEELAAAMRNSALREFRISDFGFRISNAGGQSEIQNPKSEIASPRVLLARADIATPALPDALKKAGAEVTEAVAYRTIRPASLPPRAIEALKDQRVDWITFTSSSTVENFISLLAESGLAPNGTARAAQDAQDARAVQPAQAESLCYGVKLAAIGPVTAGTLKAHGLAPTVTADPHTIDALVEAIVTYEKGGIQCEVGPTMECGGKSLPSGGGP